MEFAARCEMGVAPRADRYGTWTYQYRCRPKGRSANKCQESDCAKCWCQSSQSGNYSWTEQSCRYCWSGAESEAQRGKTGREPKKTGIYPQFCTRNPDWG